MGAFRLGKLALLALLGLHAWGMQNCAPTQTFSRIVFWSSHD